MMVIHLQIKQTALVHASQDFWNLILIAERLYVHDAHLMITILSKDPRASAFPVFFFELGLN